MVVLSADDWFCIFALFVVQIRCPAQCATGGWVLGCRVLYSSGFLCVSSHYLILPRVSSLVVQGLGVSAPTPKAQGLISQQLPVQQAKLASCSTSGARRTLGNLASQSGLISPPSHSHTEQEHSQEGPNLRCAVVRLMSNVGLPAAECFRRSGEMRNSQSE